MLDNPQVDALIEELHVSGRTPDEVRAHLVGCGVEVIAGPVTKTGALGPMTSHYCRDIDGNLIEIAVY